MGTYMQKASMCKSFTWTVCSESAYAHWLCDIAKLRDRYHRSNWSKLLFHNPLVFRYATPIRWSHCLTRVKVPSELRSLTGQTHLRQSNLLTSIWIILQISIELRTSETVYPVLHWIPHWHVVVYHYVVAVILPLHAMCRLHHATGTLY